jgi:CRISPR-associated protein Cas1
MILYWIQITVTPRQDSEEMRQKVLSSSYAKWKKRRFSKGTLHYLKKNAAGDKPFTMNRHVKERLERWGG